MDLGKTKAVSQRVKDFTFGYIREAQSLFPNDHNPYYNIPEIVAFITVLYVNIAEYFEFCGPKLKISEDQMTVKYDSEQTQDTSVYGAIRINKQDKIKKYKWKFMINIIEDSLVIDFGIVDANCKIINSYAMYQVSGTFECSDGSIVAIADANNIGSVSEDKNEDALKVNDGDIVELELNLEQQRLYFLVNQQRHYQYIKTTLEDDKEYKLAMCMDEQASVTIIDFKTL